MLVGLAGRAGLRGSATTAGGGEFAGGLARLAAAAAARRMSAARPGTGGGSGEVRRVNAGACLPLELTMTSTISSGDSVAAILDQLAAHTEQITALAAAHDAGLAALAALAARLDAVAALAAGQDARLTAIAAASAGDDEGGYQPAPARRWWQLHSETRDQAISVLRGWVEQVYRPGYGQLAAELGPCWDQHPLCLYAVDILAELWSLLYLPARRTSAILSAQAEYRPGSCPPWPARWPTRPPAATTRSAPRHGRGACHDRPAGHEPAARAGPRLRRPRLARPALPARRQAPATAQGCRDATTDPARITAGFTGRPGRNLAIATGRPGPDVLDIDIRAGGSGYPALRRLARPG